MIEMTLILVKPDGVKRCLVGNIVTRFENAGLKIIGLKMVWCDKDHALRHYTEDITMRRGQFVRDKLVAFLIEGPVVAVCLEGIDAVEVVRKIVGSTEPKTAPPGTIRGDFAHMSIARADDIKKGLPNLIHASGNKEEAKSEISLWFKDSELHSYSTVHDAWVI
ncbi:MAG TPA: nucleoside-diphosphate kinase [Candidatus Nanoarchaeia archaeon]|nr:nucleoside-diphosphate kinase [Candidatus Nanoarchaeia archaeon]